MIIATGLPLLAAGLVFGAAALSGVPIAWALAAGLGVLSAGFFLFSARTILRHYGIARAVADFRDGGESVLPSGAGGTSLGLLTDEIQALLTLVAGYRSATAQQAIAEGENDLARRAAITRLATVFEEEVSHAVEQVFAASEGLEDDAAALGHNARDSNASSNNAGKLVHLLNANIESVATAVAQLTVSIADIGQHAVTSAQITGDAVGNTERVRANVGHLVDQTRRIEEMTGLIRGIAAKTNLLSLNAAVEAARVGEAGKGFAVVASEVKGLALQAGQATVTVSDGLGEIRTLTQTAAQSMEAVKNTIATASETATMISGAVAQQEAATGQISSNAREILDGIRSMTQQVDRMCAASNHTETASRRVEDVSRQLAGQAQTLRRSVGHFLGVIRQEPGVTPEDITFGQSAALSGMTQALGCGIKDGLDAAFHEANAAGGVGGRRLVLRSFDDEYEPAKAIANVRAMMRDGGVFALLGSVGTPTAKATEPVTSAARMPFLAPMTGAAFLRDTGNRTVINLRASYGQETEALVAHLVDRLRLKRIAVFLQDDAYGQTGLAGVTKALEKRGLSLLARGSYERNGTAVERGLAEIRRSRPQAVILVGTYAACAAFIRQARQTGMNVLFANLSFVASLPLRNALGDAGRGVLVSQVVPLPTDLRIPVVAHYHRALAGLRRDLQPDFISLEGYLAGRFAVEALRRINGPITREAFLDAIFTTGPFNFDGFVTRFADGRNQGSDTVYLTEIGPDGAFRAVDEPGSLRKP